MKRTLIAASVLMQALLLAPQANAQQAEPSQAVKDFIRQREENAKRQKEDIQRQEEQQRITAERARVAREKEKAENEAAIARTKERLDQVEREDAAREAAARKACGQDYMTPRVGMPLKRAQLCLGELDLQGQVNRKDGVLSTYYGAGFYVHEMDGRVVSWGRL